MPGTLTVLIPTRNRAEYLGTALASINAAGEEARRARGITTTAFVVDDVSDDDGATRRVAERWGARYHRILQHDGRHDPGVAIATGVSMIDSDLYSLLGDDDALLPGGVVTVTDMIDEGADVVSPSYLLADACLRPTKEVLLPEATLGDLARGYSLVTDGSTVRTELVRDLTWDVSLKGMMLLPLWVRLMLDGRVFARTDVPTWLYRRHDDNISDQWSESDREIRSRVVAELQALVVAELGHLPPGPHHEARELRIANREARERAANDPATAAAAERARRRNRRLDIRVRRRLSRVIAP